MPQKSKKRFLLFPYEPLEPHLPVRNLVKFLGTNAKNLKRAKHQGIIRDTAERWTDRAGVDPRKVWLNWPASEEEWLSRRFDLYVEQGDRSRCQEWQGDRNPAGYGLFCDTKRIFGRKAWIASSLALFLAGKPKPGPKYEACHTCDNPPCVNDLHLYWGTRKNNMEDCVSRDRISRPRGAKSGRATLTEGDIEKVRIRYADGETAATLGKEYGMAVSSVGMIVTGKRWIDTPGPITKQDVRGPRPKIQRK